MVRILLAVLAYIFMIAIMVWIARQCWKDSKDDFKDAFRYAVKMFKKKRAD